jgi:putative resolvase
VDLTEWAQAQGVHVTTAYRWYREGKLPVAVQKVGLLILYARVSSPDQEADLDRQVARLSSWAARAGLPVVRVESEVGSGINGSRAKVRRLLADPKVTTVVVEHRDRLGRMNTELVDAALSAHKRRLVVLDDGAVHDDLVRDMVEVRTSFCVRLYGRRSARNRALKRLDVRSAISARKLSEPRPMIHVMSKSAGTDS